MIYLADKGLRIAEAKRTAVPRYGLTVAGYSVLSGAPTSRMVRLEGEKRWRRLMAWQFSNAGTAFIRYAGEAVVVHDSDLPIEEA